MWWLVTISVVQAVMVYVVTTLPKARRLIPAAEGSNPSASMMVEGRSPTPAVAQEEAVGGRPASATAVRVRSLQPLS